MWNEKVEGTSVRKDVPSTGPKALITSRLEENNKKIKVSRDKWHSSSSLIDKQLLRVTSVS